MSNIITIGIDLAKSVFQICGLNQANKVVFNKQVSRTKLIDAIRQHPNAVIAMEACSSSHHWARTFTSMAYTVRLIPAQHVKALSRGNKNDANDALAIAEAVSRPNIHDVQIKTLAQQDVQTLLRIRSQYKDTRTRNINQTRGLLAEYGIIIPLSVKQFERHIPLILEDASNGLTEYARDAIYEAYLDHTALNDKITKADNTLTHLIQLHPQAKKLLAIRGIGTITALALYASIGNAHHFNNARQLSAWLGLVPQQHGTGGKTTLRGISKRGSRYLRQCLIHGARTVMNWTKNKKDTLSLWVKDLVQRRGKHKAIVALANKTSRMVWVALTKGVTHCHRTIYQHLPLNDFE